MIETHTTQTLICDRCGETVDLDIPRLRPEEWKGVGNLDMCPTCFGEFTEWWQRRLPAAPPEDQEQDDDQQDEPDPAAQVDRVG